MNKESLNEKEIKILRNAIDTAKDIMGKKLVQSDNIKNIIEILEKFLRTNKTICYGGTAVNNILPEQDRFYNKSIEIPDYDFFTPFAMEYAEKLANIYYKAGYQEVEAKSGVHTGTYKVYVNFIPIADITFLDKKIFDELIKNSIKINAINYCPPNFLRMAMYLELSRPMGDVSRWEKILKRLILLNNNYPLKGENCQNLSFQRKYDGNKSEQVSVYNIAKQCFINQGVIFFGGYACSLYGKYMPNNEKKQINSIPDFDILSTDPYSSAVILKEQLIYNGFKDIKINKKNQIGEYIDIHYEVIVNNDVIAFIYKANACHSYNVITINKNKIKIASIDTILTFYLIFIYSSRNYYDINRLLCMAEYLFKVQLKNRLNQKGLLKRFSIQCYGKQKTLEDIREEKSKIYEKTKMNKKSKLYNINFFRYLPKEENKNKYSRKKKQNTKKNTKQNTKKYKTR
tara:strand:+ start:525 stop:1895 length:1371 start_codon:yes stop_codon:yes gene_type:complete